MGKLCENCKEAEKYYGNLCKECKKVLDSLRSKAQVRENKFNERKSKLISKWKKEYSKAKKEGRVNYASEVRENIETFGGSLEDEKL